MQLPQIRTDGVPQVDGTVSCYVAEAIIGKPWYNPARPVIFVNGMLNDGDGHRGGALFLSEMLGSRVYGVYNATRGGLTDLWQCITDKFKFASGQAADQTVIARIPKFGGDFQTWAGFVELAYQAEKAKAPALSKDDYVYTLLGSNPATKSLYALLLAQPGGLLGLPIHAHSQGNLITSNALTGVALARGLGAIAGLEVVSYGSPAQGWPAGLRRTNNAFTFDGVSFLDGTMDFSSSKVGYKFAHGLNPLVHRFELYKDYDAEFIVNKFRTGGWGVTVNMDEKGLAQFCHQLGNNTDRLGRIFDRLEKAHWTDSDDVALEYVQLKSDSQLAELNQISPLFVAQLVRLLKAGYTSRGEQAAIDRLEAVRMRADGGVRA